MTPRLAIHLALPIGARTLRATLESEERAIAIVGPSGIGKSTVLRAIAGLVPSASGRVVIGSVVLQDDARGQRIAPEARAIGWVPQDALLFPHLPVRENVAFSRPTRAVLDDAIERTGIGALLDRAPATLSGGERQRVAIARALARRPRVLLLDEPLAALDREGRAPLARALADWSAAHDVTTILVAHDEADVASLATDVFALGTDGIDRVARDARDAPPRAGVSPPG